MKRAFKIILKVIAGITGTILGLVILFIILLRLPSVQNYVTHKAVSFISSKTHSRVELHRLYIDFPKSLVVEDLFAEDMKHDTLAYIKKLSVDIDLLKLINKKVEIRDVTLTNATAYIIRNEVDSSFNFDFIVKAFGSGGKAAPKTVSKDSSAPWQVGVDKVSLENIRGGFTDEVGGTVIKGFIGKLKLDMKAMDISKLSFTGNKLQLQDADVSVFQNKPGKNSPDTAIVLMPLLSLNELALQRVNFVYQNKPGDQSIKVSAANLLIQPDTIDLNRHIIKVKNANIQGTDAIVILRKNANDTISLKAIADSITSPAAPWLIASEKLILSKVSFQFDLSNVKPQPAGVDYNHLLVKDINVNIIKASYSPDRILADIKNISLREKSGFVLKQLKARGVYDNQHIELQDLSLTTNHTSIGNYAKITYSSIASLGTNIADMGIDADLKNTRVSVADILMFAPQLKNIAVFKANQDNVVNVTGKVHGKLKDLEVSNLLVSLLDSTIIDLDGHVVGLPDAINANYDVQLNRVLTNRKDIESIAGTYLPSSINIPSTISLSGTINGSVKNAKATLALKTSSGTADIQAELKMAKSDTQYIVSLSTKELDIGYLLKQPKLLGTVTLTANASGKSFSLPNMVTDLKADIQSLFFNKYRYHNISLTANADSNTYKADVAINDSALIMDLHSALSLVKKQEYVKADLNITGANLQALNLLQQDIRTSGRLSADLQGDIEDLNGSASLSDVILVKGKDTYKLDSVIVVSVNDSKHSALKINSGLVVADYDGTVKIPKLVSSLTHQLNHYFVMFSEADSSKLDTSDQNFTLTVKVLPNPIINDVLLPSLTAFNGAELDAKYDGSKSNLDVNISVPVFTYGSSSLDDAKVKVSANKDALDYKISVANTKSGPLNLAETKLEGNVKDNKVQFGLSVYDRDSAYKLIIGGNLAQEQRKQYKLHLNHDKLVINNTRWHLPEDNFVRFDSSGFFANDLNLSNGEQSLMAQSEGTNGDVLKVLFKQFQLGTLSQIIEADTALIRGSLNGTVDFRNLQRTPAFVSDLKVSDIFYQMHPVGDIQLKADNLSANKYSAQLTLKGFENDVQLKGYYSNEGTSNALDFKADIVKLNLQTVEPFTFGQLRRSSGYLTGDFKVAGTIKQPIITGGVSFKNAAFNVAYLNNYLQLKDERISIDQHGIYFKSFTVLDSLGQKASLTGAVYTSDFKKMKFDLAVRTDNFTVLNTTIQDNSLYFGQLILSSDIRISGNEALPVIKADLKLLKGSNIAVVIPSSKISVDRGEGVVVLTDTATNYSIMQAKDTTVLITGLKGVNVSANIEVTKQTSFKLIVDKTSGDSLVVRGDGLLSFNMDESGNQNLTGTYVLDNGGYKATFQKIIKRELKIQQGGTITWNGSPLDAIVDITAAYSVRTPPADLLSSELASSTTDERNAYQKPILFSVLMSMKGQLLKPDITFKLDMADQDKDAYGGVVYAKINSLNNDPSELNKQVFALLIMNKFIPAGVGGNVDYGSAATSLARNSLNQILTDQLNRLSGKFIKGVDVNFGIRANDDYTSSGVQQNTEVSVGLKKQFFKDRLSVQVGTSVNVQNNNGSIKGADANSLTGDIVVEYKINKDGTLRFKAFRENEYEGIIDGSLYKTGVGLVLNKDYNTVKELFKSKKKAKKEAAQKQAGE